jgi:hypothetical protein
MAVTLMAAGLEFAAEVPLLEVAMLNGPVFTQEFRAQYDIAPEWSDFS